MDTRPQHPRAISSIQRPSAPWFGLRRGSQYSELTSRSGRKRSSPTAQIAARLHHSCLLRYGSPQDASRTWSRRRSCQGSGCPSGRWSDWGTLEISIPHPLAAGPSTCQTPGVQRFAESQDFERQEEHQKLTRPREAINRKQTSSPETKARPHHVPSQDPKAPTHARCPADNDSSICTSGPSTPGPLPAIVRDH
ncbi:hypothetical protein CMUS01_06120 [Colletotrichum musicola]|uniref:Uncharacterized protein n=1 Tax=Colletotrichum musicola TaxID=2175873 RepID=A0A8H6KMY1_9PEZI|nr:hypothetical protein CMUS01_06120 [Colletotrichum musicola]